MIKNILILLILTFAWYNLESSADVIFLKTGGIEEGYLTQDGDKYILEERTRDGSVSFSTSIVESISYNQWIDDLTYKTKNQVTKSKPKPKPKSKTKSSISEIIRDPVEDIQPALDKSQEIFDVYKKSTEKLLGVEMQASDVTKNFKDFIENAPWNFWPLLAIFIIMQIKAIIVSIVIIIDAFKNHIIHGLCVLFIPFYFAIYLLFIYRGHRLQSIFWLTLPTLYIFIWALLLTLSN